MTRWHFVWTIVALVAGVAGFLGGRALLPQEAAAHVFAAETPAYVGAPSAVGVSLGGFSGFGETSHLEGKTVLTGRVLNVGSDGVAIETPWGTASIIVLRGDRPLRLIEAASLDDLQAGTTVVAQTGPGGSEAEGVLIVAQP